MSAGVSAELANAMLQVIGDPYIQLHFADPGIDGTSNIASMPGRIQADLSAASDGTRVLVTSVEWPNPWSGGAQTVTHLTLWDSPVNGSLMCSAALASQIDFVDGMIPRLVSLSVAVVSLMTD